MRTSAHAGDHVILLAAYIMGLTSGHNVKKTQIYKIIVDPIKEEDDNRTTKVATTTIIRPVTVVLATRTKIIFKANNNNKILNRIQITKSSLIFPASLEGHKVNIKISPGIPSRI
jgi:hypothetical protein